MDDIPPRRLRLQRLLPVLALVVLALIFFRRLAFSNLILARGDTFLYFYPYWSAAASALRAGRVPLWNSDIFMGAPFLANSQVGFLYPLNWLFWLLLRTPYAVSASIILHVIIAGWGTYLAGRRALALRPVAALFAAVLFALGGYLTAQAEHVNQLQGLAWLPWYFAAVAPLRNLDARKPDGGLVRVTLLQMAVVVGALFALQLLAGHTQTVFISGVALALWLVVDELAGPARAAGRGGLSPLLRAGGVLGSGIALAALLAAAQLLPTLELTGLSSRQGGLPLKDVLSFSWHPLHLTRALLPAYGQTLFSEYVAFLPVTALALAVAGGWAWRREPAVRPWLLLLVAALVLALGRFTPIYYALGRLPGFDLFRVPARWLVIAALAASLLAGRGWQLMCDYAVADRSATARPSDRRPLLIPLLAAAALLSLLIIWGYAAGALAAFIPTGAEAPFEHPSLRALAGWLIEAALLALLLGTTLVGRPDRARLTAYGLIALALAALWLGSRGLPYDRLTTPEAYFDLRPPAARLLAEAGCPSPCDLPLGRFLSMSDIFFEPGETAEIESIYADQLDPDARYDYIVAVKQKEVLSPNLSMVPGLPAVDGFDGGILPLQAYTQLMRLILPEGAATTDGRLREYLVAAPDVRWLNLFNGRYLITDKVADIWREGVFFDRQLPFAVTDEAPAVAEIPEFEATELWLLSDESPPQIELEAGGEVVRLEPQLLAPPDLYRVIFSTPILPETIRLLPCRGRAVSCGTDALTLVDSRDGTFQTLAPAPYRLIHSGDVKLYENLAVLPRAFLVNRWQWQTDPAAVIDDMRDRAFDPPTAAILLGDGAAVAAPAQSAAGDARGTVEVTSYAPERITMRAEGDGGLVVLADAYYPGWEATLDSEPVTIYQTDGLFRGLFVPAGSHDIELDYRPRSFRVGLALSIGGLILAAALAGVRRRAWSGRRGAN